MKVVLRPPLVAFSLILISVILHFIFPIKIIIALPYTLFGIFGIIFGLGLALWGKKTFEKLKTSVRFGKPTKLVTSGPYTFTRNPMYLGFVIFLLGISVLLGSIIAFIAPLMFFIIMNFGFISFEEKWMEKIFGKKYREYKKRVRRWI